MAKTASQIVDYALTLVDEQVTEFATAASTEMSLREIGLEILPQVCRDFVKELPWELKRYLATTATLIEDATAPAETYYKRKVTFICPTDFWELAAIRLSVWTKPVTEYLLLSDPAYIKQDNPHTRGGKQSPVVAISNATSGGGRVIECFSVGASDTKTVSVFEYISFDNIPNDSGQTWPDEVFDEICKALSSELLVIKGQIDQGMIRGEDAANAITQHA